MAVLSRATLYGLVTGLVLCAALGWPFVAVYALIVGPSLGWHHVSSTNREKAQSE